MLLKSLNYFWVKFWGLADSADITRISGETYWLYRIYAEAAVFLVGCLALFGPMFLAAPAEFPLPNRIGLACVFAFLGWTEWARLQIELREQRQFASIFYD